jgi:hypothetical protein
VKGRAFWVALGTAALAGGASGATRSPAAVFVVQPDPRLCPSPLCGGYWVAEANRARTRCHDGLLRPRCYVAEVANDGAVPPAPGSLVRGSLVVKQYGGLGDLGVLAADAVWSPVGRATPSGRFYRLRDLGIRCVRAPCFSVSAVRLNVKSRTTVSSVGLATLAAKDRTRVTSALSSAGGVLAQGRIARTGDGGRAFLVTRFFLASER